MFKGRSAMSLMNQGNQEQLGGAAQAMKAQQGYAQAANPILQQSHDTLQDDLNKFWNGWQRPDGTYRPGYTQSLDEIDKVKQDILTNNINPNRFIEQGALPKVMTAIGLLGTMANSRGGGAKILDFMNQQMQRDVQAQIADKSGKVNVLQANLHQLGNMQDAIKMTTFQHMAMQSALLEQAANNTNSQMAKSVYMQTAGQIHQQMAKQVYDWTMGGVMAQKVGAGGAGGMQGMQGGAQKGGEGPTDAVGNPLPQGMNINPMYYKQMNPVQMPGGQSGYGFARDANAAGRAGAAIGSHDVLDSAIKRVQDAWGTGMAWNPFGSDLAAKKSAIDNLHAAVRQLGGPGKLTPEQREAYEKMASLPANPGFWNKTSSQQQLKDLGNVNNDTLNAELGSDINNYVPPKQPGNSKRLVD
jgi:hypothetical protein